MAKRQNFKKYCSRCGQALDLEEFKARKEEKESGQQDNGDLVFT